MTAKPIVTPKLPADLVQNRLPHHIAVIMDGNGRWAKRRGLPRIMGHQRGVDTLKVWPKRRRDINLRIGHLP